MISARENVPAHHLITSQDRGGLLYQSECEIVFKGMVSGDDFQEPKINQKSNLNLKLKNMVLGTLESICISATKINLFREI